MLKERSVFASQDRKNLRQKRLKLLKSVIFSGFGAVKQYIFLISIQLKIICQKSISSGRRFSIIHVVRTIVQCHGFRIWMALPSAASNFVIRYLLPSLMYKMDCFSFSVAVCVSKWRQQAIGQSNMQVTQKSFSSDLDANRITRAGKTGTKRLEKICLLSFFNGCF